MKKNVSLISGQPSKHDASILTSVNTLLSLLVSVKGCLVSTWGASYQPDCLVFDWKTYELVGETRFLIGYPMQFLS